MSRPEGKTPLVIMLTAGDHGYENNVSMKVMMDNGWRKHVNKKDVENNKMTEIEDYPRSDKCYKIFMKDNTGDGMSYGDGSYETMVNGKINFICDIVLDINIIN